jgi:small subunit ribosomal protein S6
MRQYETVFLISPNLEEDRWGKKKLAYPIKKFEEAFYVFFHYEGDSDIPFELEKRFKQTETILRFLTVKKEARENVRKKRRRIPAGEAEATVEEEEIITPQEEEVEQMREEEIVAPAEEEEKKKEEGEPEEKKKEDQEDLDSAETSKEDK